MSSPRPSHPDPAAPRASRSSSTRPTPADAAPGWTRERKIYLAVGVVIMLVALVLLLVSL